MSLRRGLKIAHVASRRRNTRHLEGISRNGADTRRGIKILKAARREETASPGVARAGEFAGGKNRHHTLGGEGPGIAARKRAPMETGAGNRLVRRRAAA